MLATTHVLVGAVAGRAVANPIASFSLAVILHFILDKIPHFWPDNKSIKIQGAILAIEWSIAILFILFLSDNPDFLYSQFTGAIGGFLPDVILLPTVKTKIGKWHAIRQTHTQKIKDAIIEAVIILSSIAVLIFWR